MPTPKIATGRPGEPQSPARAWFSFHLATLFVWMTAMAALFASLKAAETIGPIPAAAVCIVAGTLTGLIELQYFRGFGALRGRLFHGTLGGALGGAVFAGVTITLEWLAVGDPPGDWGALALRMALWLLWGGLAGGVLGVIADALLAKQAVVQRAVDPRAGEFLSHLDEPPPGS